MVSAPTVPANIAAFRNLWTGANGVDGFLAGDMGFSVKGPDGSFLFIFGDSAQQPNLFTHSTGIRWSNNGLHRVPPSNLDGSFLPAPQGLDSANTKPQVYWPISAVVVGMRLYVFADRVTYENPGDLFGFKTWGRDVVVYNWIPGSNPSLDHVGTTPSSNRPSDATPQIMWGAGGYQLGNYTYIYGSYNEPDWYGSNRMYLARVPTNQPGSIDTPSSWTFWNGTSFIPDESAVAIVIDEHLGAANNLSAFTGGVGWTLVSKGDGNLGNNVRKWTSPNPWGPWTLTDLFAAPYQSPVDPAGIQYGAFGHYEIRPLGDGKRIVSVSHNHSGGTSNDMFTHPEWYKVSFEGV